jgi:plasmid stabilization system protein ParE
MSYTLHWTSEAARTLEQNLEYLEDEWGNQVINNFLDRVEEVLENIRGNPQLYPLHRPKDTVRRCAVHKRVILFYKIVDDRHIDLLTFWNTYQDPDKLKV